MPNDWIESAKEIKPELSIPDILLARDKFVDYWHAELGTKAIKLDWFATWRNWIRSDWVKPSNTKQFKSKEPDIDFNSTDWINGIGDML